MGEQRQGEHELVFLTRRDLLRAGTAGLGAATLLGTAGNRASATAAVAGREDVPVRSAITWGRRVLIDNVQPFDDNGPSEQPTIQNPGTWGSMYGRMVRLADGDWLEANEASLTNAYLHDPNGGLRLRVHRSSDDGRSWSHLATIADPGRDLDNPQLVQLGDGSILLACRSVIWTSSYRLPVYRSTDGGRTWSYLSTIDSNENAGLRHGMYEPHMGFLANGELAVTYANEKHVEENPSYSQIISQRVSTNGGASWGEEIWTVYQRGGGNVRPGMPTWTRMENGRYMLVYEVCAVDPICYAHYKTSGDGTTWRSGYEGMRIPKEHNQAGGPYGLALRDGRLLVTSNRHEVSISDDNGASWYLNDTRPWTNGLWSSMYQTGENEVAVINSVERPWIAGRSYNVQVRFGAIEPSR